MSATERIELGLKVLAACVAVFGIWKYFADRQVAVEAEAKARSLAYIQRFASDGMVSARSDLVRFWQRYPDFATFARDSAMTRREYANFVRAAYPADPGRQDVDDALFRILTFYGEVFYCRLAGICDTEMIDAFFCPHAVPHANVYAPFYVRMSEEIGARAVDATLQEFGALCSLRTQ